MGHAFLRHVERTSLLLLIVDIFGFQLSHRHIKRNCLENIFALNKELELYDKTLLDKPAVLLVNKMDLEGSIEEYIKYENFFENLQDGLHLCPEEIKPTQILNFERVIPISAKSNKEIDKVKLNLREILDIVEKRKLEEVDDVNENLLQRKLMERGPKIV